MIIELLKTGGWRRKLSRKSFEEQWNSFVEKHGKNFRTEEAKKVLVILVG